MNGTLVRTRADEILDQGIEQGQNETAALFGFLLRSDRSEDAVRASVDQAFLKKLFLEFRDEEQNVN